MRLRAKAERWLLHRLLSREMSRVCDEQSRFAGPPTQQEEYLKAADVDDAIRKLWRALARRDRNE
jgi:hypothetical protein